MLMNFILQAYVALSEQDVSLVAKGPTLASVHVDTVQ